MTSLTLMKAVAGLSVTAAGTTGAYFLLRPVTYSIDKFALETTDGTWSWTNNSPTLTQGQKADVKITGTLTKATGNETKTWACSISGTVTSPSANSSWDAQTQLTALKTTIGVDNTPRDSSKQDAFKTFIESCISHRKTTPTETNSESTIDLGELEKTGSTYKFKDSEFKAIYGG